LYCIINRKFFFSSDLPQVHYNKLLIAPVNLETEIIFILIKILAPSIYWDNS